jgi:hypothetical protein
MTTTLRLLGPTFSSIQSEIFEKTDSSGRAARTNATPATAATRLGA